MLPQDCAAVIRLQDSSLLLDSYEMDSSQANGD